MLNYDRLARLLHQLLLLCNNRDGMTVSEMAEHCQVSERQIYRDIKTLEEHLHVPFWKPSRNKIAVTEWYMLPAINLSLPEAMTLFFACRLLRSYMNTYNPAIATTLLKLYPMVTGPFGEQIRKDVEWMQRQREDERFSDVLQQLGTAWRQGRCARIDYLTLGEQEPKERVIEPYFIQPSVTEHGTYVIARCRLTDSVRTFKVERIQSIELLDARYTIPHDFDANEYLGSSIGITTGGRIRTVKLKFAPEVARIAEETVWHPSQQTQLELDGSIIVTMKIQITQDIYTRILGWGDRVEVLAPRSLRDGIARSLASTLNIYNHQPVE